MQPSSRVGSYVGAHLPWYLIVLYDISITKDSPIFIDKETEAKMLDDFVRLTMLKLSGF